MIQRRSAIEPTIGHMKSNGKLDRNWLKGALGDAIHAVLCGAEHNLRLINNKLKANRQPNPIYWASEFFRDDSIVAHGFMLLPLGWSGICIQSTRFAATSQSFLH
jgi:hypothetical protein